MAEVALSLAKPMFALACALSLSLSKFLVALLDLVVARLVLPLLTLALVVDVVPRS